MELLGSITRNYTTRVTHETALVHSVDEFYVTY